MHAHNTDVLLILLFSFVQNGILMNLIFAHFHVKHKLFPAEGFSSFFLITLILNNGFEPFFLTTVINEYFIDFPDLFPYSGMFYNNG